MPAQPCGPWYDDAHRGQREPQLYDLDEFAYALWYPGDSLVARDQRGQDAIAAALAAEARGDAAVALDAWRAALLALNGFGERYALINRTQDRVDVLASTPAAHASTALAYARARDAVDVVALETLRAGGGPCADNAAFALLAPAMRDEDAGAVLIALERFVADWPTSDKRDAAQFLRARTLLRLAQGGDPDGLGTASDAFARYLADRPNGNYRVEALGWQAHIAVRAGHPDGAAYRRLLANRDAHALFLAAVRSQLRDFTVDPPTTEELSAEPRLAALWLFARMSNGHLSVQPQETTTTVARATASAVPSLIAAGLPGEVLGRIAQVLRAAGESTAAYTLASAAPGDPTALYLIGRHHTDTGDAEAAWEVFERLLALDKRFAGLRDLGLRVGAAYEQAGLATQALRCYAAVGSWSDVAIVADGEVPLTDLVAVIDAGIPMRSRLVDGDALPEGRLADILAARLARVDRLAEARTHAAPQRRMAIDRLLALRAAAAAAPEAQRAARHYEVAAFWYRSGKQVVFVGSGWQQTCTDGLVHSERRTAADQEREGNLRAMTGHVRAKELFLEIVARWPGSDEAAKALYSAALCDYWLCGNTYLGSCGYWGLVSARDGYWSQGDALMRQLHREHPDHPLARSEWVRKVLAGESHPPGEGP